MVRRDQNAFPKATRACLYLALAALTLAPLLHDLTGCPFGLHDWSVPCFSEQTQHLVAYVASPWLALNLGQPNPLPVSSLPGILIWAVMSLSPMIALRVFLMGCFVAAAWGADLLVGEMLETDCYHARVAAGIAYASAPFLITKLTAGHIYFLIDAALVPFALLYMMRSRGALSRDALISALVTSALFMQPQVGLTFLVLILLAFGWRQYWRALFLVGAFAIIVWSPALYCSLVAFSSGSLGREAQLATWLFNQSIPLAKAFSGTYYFAHYYEEIAGGTVIAVWQVICAGGIIASLLFGGFLRRMAAVGIAYAILATGTAGPLGPEIAFLFRSFPATSLFRELYDLLWLIPLVAACGIAVAIHNLFKLLEGRLWLLLSAGIVEAALLCTIAFPCISGASSSLIPLASPALWQAQVTRIDKMPGTGRVLWLPSAVPIGPVGSRGGADPFWAPVGDHPAANSYHATGPAQYAGALGDGGDRLSGGLLRRLGVQAVVSRPGLRTFELSAAAHPVGRRSIALASRVSYTQGRVTELAIARGKPQCMPALYSMMQAKGSYIRCSNGRVTLFQEATTVKDDPTRDWLSGERWSALDPELVDPVDGAIFTLSGKAYHITTTGSFLIYAPLGAYLDGRRIRARGIWQAAVCLDRKGCTLRAKRGALVALASGSARGSALPGIGGPEQSISANVSNRYLGVFAVYITPYKGVERLILREGWSNSWRMVIGGSSAVHQEADGYANAWTLPPSIKPHWLLIVYTPVIAYMGLCALSFAITLIAIVICCRGARGLKRSDRF